MPCESSWTGFGIIAACGVVLTAGYILWMFQNVYMGKDRKDYDGYQPVNRREYFIMGTLGVAALVFGVAPFLVFELTPVDPGSDSSVPAGDKSLLCQQSTLSNEMLEFVRVPRRQRRL